MLLPGSGTEQSRQATSKRGDVKPARDFARLSSGFWFSEHAFQAWLLAFGVCGLVIVDLLIQVGINRWSRLFFDALNAGTQQLLFSAYNSSWRLQLRQPLLAQPSSNARCGCKCNGDSG